MKESVSFCLGLDNLVFGSLYGACVRGCVRSTAMRGRGLSTLGGNHMHSFARSFSRQCFVLLVVLALLGLPLAAQDATGRIIGVVTDPSGGVIANAKVTVTNVATGISNTTT